MIVCNLCIGNWYTKLRIHFVQKKTPTYKNNHENPSNTEFTILTKPNNFNWPCKWGEYGERLQQP